MNDPRRLGDGDAHVEALMRAARSFTPSPRARRRTLRALGLPLATSLLGAAWAPALASSTATKVLVAVVAAASLGGAGLVYDSQTRREPKPRPVVTERRVARAPVTKAAPPAPAPPVEVAPVIPQAPAPPAPRRRPPAPAQVVVAPAVIAPPSEPTTPPPVSAPVVTVARPRLAPELVLLSEAARAVRAGRGRDALALLDEHARMSRGVLADEATVLRIEALAGIGDRAAAQSLSQSFLSLNPRSVHAARVRAVVSALQRP